MDIKFIENSFVQRALRVLWILFIATPRRVPVYSSLVENHARQLPRTTD
jgi:hypothetical protein